MEHTASHSPEYLKRQAARVAAHTARVASDAKHLPEARTAFTGRNQEKIVYTDRGEEFTSTRAAAVELAADLARIRAALVSGYRYAGRRWSRHPTFPPPPTLVAVKCEATGETWATPGAAAAELGVKARRIRTALADGRPLAGRVLTIGPDYAKRGSAEATAKRAVAAVKRAAARQWQADQQQERNGNT
jgi:hypothetical protein